MMNVSGDINRMVYNSYTVISSTAGGGEFAFPTTKHLLVNGASNLKYVRICTDPLNIYSAISFEGGSCTNISPTISVDSTEYLFVEKPFELKNCGSILSNIYGRNAAIVGGNLTIYWHIILGFSHE